MAHIKFDSSNLTKFVHDNELNEMQAMVNAADEQLRQGTGAGADFRGWLDLPVDYDKEEFARIKEAAKKDPKRFRSFSCDRDRWFLLRCTCDDRFLAKHVLQLVTARKT